MQKNARLWIVSFVLMATTVLAGPTRIASAESHQFWSTRVSAQSAQGLVVSPDGTQVFVLARSVGAVPHILTVAYEVATGRPEWQVVYRGQGEDTPSAIGVSPDGTTVFVAGTTETAGNRYDFITLAFRASDGQLLWTQLFDVSEGDLTVDLAVSPDGSALFVFGSGTTNRGDNFETVAYQQATGTELWQQIYSSPGDGTDHASAGTISPDGSLVYVTGVTPDGSEGTDFLTIAYEADSGVQAWTATYHDDNEPWD